jgi:ornithine cyclodeaminase/alanine dehydrogenase-like protein (mu-crystallin family)
MDGAMVTAVRTAAASAAVADALATAQSSELAVLGSGVQGRGHVHAIRRVRPVRVVRMWSPSEERRHRVARELASELGLAVEPCASAEEAVRNADIVATCTLSLEPVLRGGWLSPGTTVLSVGSFEPHRHEIDAAVIERAAAVVIDDPATAARHAGPIVAAISEGRLGVDDLVPVGEVIVGRVRARTSSEDVIYYNSTGLGVQDAAACWAVIGRAHAVGAGQTIAL